MSGKNLLLLTGMIATALVLDGWAADYFSGTAKPRRHLEDLCESYQHRLAPAHPMIRLAS